MASPGGRLVGRLRVKVVPDTSGFADELRRDLRQIRRQVRDIRVGVRPDVDTNSFRAANQRIRRILRDQTVSVRARFSGVGGGGGRRGIAGILSNPYVLAAAILAASSALSPLIGGLVVATGLIAGMIAPLGVVALGFDGIKNAFKGLSPAYLELQEAINPILEDAFEPLVETLNNIQGIIIPGITRIAESWKPVIEAISDVLQESADSGQLARILAQSALIMEDLAPLVGTLTEMLLDLVENVLPYAAPFLRDFNDALAETEGEWGPVISLIQLATEDFSTLFGVIIRNVPEMVASLLVMSKGSHAAISGIASLFKGLGRTAEVLWQELKTGMNNTRESFHTFGGGVKGILIAVGVALISFAQAAIVTFGEFVATILHAGEVVASGVARMTSAFGVSTEKIPFLLGVASRTARGLARKLADALPRILGSAGSKLASAGRRIMESFISAVRGKIDEVKSLFSGLTSSIPDWKGPAERDRKLLRQPANLIMDGFIDQVASRFSDVETTFGRTPIDVTNTLAAGERVAAGGVTQYFTVDPATSRGYVEEVSRAASQGASRALSLRMRRAV